MCGIFAYSGKVNGAVELTFESLKTLEYRGYDSWGVSYLDEKGDLRVEKQAGRIGDSVIASTPSKLAIGHTRWATHGGVTRENAHPHCDCKGRLALVHNGIVENYQELKEKLVKRGHKFVSETDSEVIAHLLEEEIEGQDDWLRVAAAVYKKLMGMNAFMVMDKVSGALCAARRGSPLLMGERDGEWHVTSDVVALAGIVDRVVYLDDDDVLVVEGGKCRMMNVRANARKKLNWQKLELNEEAIDKGKFDHFMIKEISEQPGLLRENLQGYLKSARVIAKELDKAENIHIVGAGTAYHASLLGSYLLSGLARVSARAYPGAEFEWFRPVVGKKDASLFVSQSGETIDIVEQAGILKKEGKRVLAMVNRPMSTLARMADAKMDLNAGVEQCVLATKSFLMMTLGFTTMAWQLAGKDEGQLRREIGRVAEAVSVLIGEDYRKKYIRPLAKKLAKHEHIFVIGRGMFYPMALEGALKIKEVTYVHAEAFASSELKHGVIALVDEGTPCMVISGREEDSDADGASAVELKSRGGWMIGMGQKNNDVFDVHVPAQLGSDWGMFEITVMFQLLAYEMALIMERDPDKPRNLAKSVTVK